MEGFGGHTVEMFELQRGNASGDDVEKPTYQLAVLPNTIHFGIVGKLQKSTKYPDK
jgi:hypothetical protein